MTKYRVKKGLHIIKGDVRAEGSTFELESDTFADSPDRARFFEKVLAPVVKDGDKEAAEKAELDRLAAEKAELDRLAAEKAELDRLAAEKALADKELAEQKAAAKEAKAKEKADRKAAAKTAKAVKSDVPPTL